MRSRVNDMISATQRMAYTRRSPGLTFKLATGRIRPIGGLGTQERVAVGADRGKPWLEKFPDFLIRIQDLIFSFSRKVWSIFKRLAILGNFLQANNGGKIMIHLIWYIVVGLIAGIIAKSVMHVHMTIFWTIVLGIIGSIIGGAVTHMFSHPTTGRFHPAGLIFSTLGAILLLYVCLKLNIRFPRVL